ISYGEAKFSKDGKSIFVTTDKDSEFHRLAIVDLRTRRHEYLTSEIPWDIEMFDLSNDGERIAFVANENGQSAVWDFYTKIKGVPHKNSLPPGVIGALRWRKNGRELGFAMNNARSAGDCYSLDVNTGRLERWTTSETAVKTDSFKEAE